MSEQTLQILDNFLKVLSKEVDSLITSFPVNQLEQAREIIQSSELDGGRIHVTGIGKPSYVAKYSASLLSSTGTPAYFLDGTEAIHGSSGQVLVGDVVICISNSGETEELKSTITTLQKNGAKIISVTGGEKSWLSEQSDCTLLAKVEHEGDSLDKPPRASIIVEIATLQALSVLLQESKGLTPTDYIKWHPGGTLGESIRKEAFTR